GARVVGDKVGLVEPRLAGLRAAVSDIDLVDVGPDAGPTGLGLRSAGQQDADGQDQGSQGADCQGLVRAEHGDLLWGIPRSLRSLPLQAGIAGRRACRTKFGSQSRISAVSPVPSLRRSASARTGRRTGDIE